MLDATNNEPTIPFLPLTFYASVVWRSLSVGVPTAGLPKQYPLGKQGKTWELITVEGGAGRVYRYDLQLNVAR